MISSRRETLTSTSRGGVGRLRIAVARATETERTAEIRRDASIIPQVRAGARRAAVARSVRLWSMAPASTSSSAAVATMRFGDCARYSGWPTKNATCCGGLAACTSSQNLSRCREWSTLIRTRLYRSARHHDRASLMSQAQSTSVPSLRKASARNSRFAAHPSTSRTRFRLTGPGIGSDNVKDTSGVVMPISPLI